MASQAELRVVDSLSKPHGGSRVSRQFCAQHGVLCMWSPDSNFSSFSHGLSTSRLSTPFLRAMTTPLTNSSCAVMKVLDLALQLLPLFVAGSNEFFSLLCVSSSRVPSVLRTSSICNMRRTQDTYRHCSCAQRACLWYTGCMFASISYSVTF